MYTTENAQLKQKIYITLNIKKTYKFFSKYIANKLFFISLHIIQN